MSTELTPEEAEIAETAVHGFGADFKHLRRVETPIGEQCVHCKLPISAGDVGVTMLYMTAASRRVPYHHACLLVSLGLSSE